MTPFQYYFILWVYICVNSMLSVQLLGICICYSVIITVVTVIVVYRSNQVIFIILVSFYHGYENAIPRDFAF
ncbi:hypothetical protein MsAc7_00660 [Methanolapillus millepedarum]|uniref:Uncharacterized protein n=1 Tax=Methanolapillus millepedarum TaxID=3028296 RepID=A0AA96ZTH6_9EURY|nr:hypothetical protein MsAc7_00660 [Methanosarcinaceae archaeon Ac7]